MGKKNSELSKYREWERERRERLNVSFNDLGSLLPNHDPAISTSKVDILQKSAAYIRDLKKENSDLILGGSNKIQTKKIKRLQRYVEVLLLRVQQLAKLLKDAGISLPPEPPSITPLGEKPLRWSNKLSPKDAEKALQAVEKSPKSGSQKKSKSSKKAERKDTNSSAEKSDKVVDKDAPGKPSNPSDSLQNSSAAESPPSGNKLRSSQQKTNAESPTLVLPHKEKTSQESRPSMPVNQLFGDTSHVLTSLPPHVVSADQQPGIIVIRTTGASTLGAMTQQPPQSTCFVIDSGSGGAVANGQAGTIVASHQPTLEQRPTFVLASNGSFLPVLSAPQFVTQPRQLIVSTSSPPVPPAKQTLAPISFTASNNSQCRKPINQILREVACSKPLTGDLSQLKKVPIPALPRNKQKLVSNSKDGKDGIDVSAKVSAKKKCVNPDGESSKSSKSVTIRSTEKKNVKSTPEITSQVKQASPNKSLSQDAKITTNASEKPASDKKESNLSAASSTLSKDNPTDSRKRDLDMKTAGENIKLKKKKCENSTNEDKSIPKPSIEKQPINNNHVDSIGHNNAICNVLSGNTAFNTLASSCSVSSYSIDALCKMNEKISADGSNESLKDAVSPRNENSAKETNLCVKEKVQQIQDISDSDNMFLSKSSASENIPKSVSSACTAEISRESANSASDCASESLEQLSKDSDRERLNQVNSSTNHSSQPEESGPSRNISTVSNCSTEIVSSNRDGPSIPENVKESAVIDSEIKEKSVVESPILPSFGSSPNFPHSSEDVYRKEEGRETNCENSGVDESSLPPGTFSSDLFASLQVPSGHSESISPTAAFLLAFPLVSTLTGKTPDLGSDNHPSQPLASLDSGNGDSEHSSGGCGSSFLQLGNLEDNSPSSSSQSILSSLSSSHTPLQSSIIHLKSANTLHSLLSSSIESNYGRETVDTDIHQVERQVSTSKDISSKEVVTKDESFTPSLQSSVALKENQMLQDHLVSKEAPPMSKRELSSSKAQNLKENESEYRNQTNGKVSSRDVTEVTNISGRYSSHMQKPASCDNSSVSNTQNERMPVSSASTKPTVHVCHNNQLEVVTRTENAKKDAVDHSVLPSSNQQYIPYQMPYLSCSSTGLSEQPIATSNGLINSDGSTNNGPDNLRQQMQALDHALSNTSNSHVELSNLPQTSSSLSFPSVNPIYKNADKSHSSDHKQQIQDNAYPSNSYSQYNPTTTMSSPVSSTSCFTISSFTSSFPSSVSNSLLSSCTVTTSASFSSPNSSLLLTTPSSYSNSSTSFPANSNTIYSSSYIPPIYSNTLTQPLSSSTASFSNTSFTPASESMISSAPPSKTTTTTTSKTSVPSLITASTSHQNSFGTLHSNSLPPTSFVNSASSASYDCGQKLNAPPIPTSHQHCNQTPKNSNASLQQKTHDQGSSSAMNLPVSEPVKSHNIFSIDQLNTQNYGYNYNDYNSHMPSYMPQKPETEMTRKLPNLPSETLGGNITSRMPGSFSVAHNSSNFSILSWTTLSPMSAAPSASIDPQMNSVNGNPSHHGPAGAPSIENGSSSTEKTSESHTSSFPQSILPDNREITSSYPQFPVGNSNNTGTELNGPSGYPSSQDIGKQSGSRGNGPKQRQQVTNWMTAPDPIHSSSDFSHTNEPVNNDHVRDAFGNNTASYGSNSGFYGHHNHLDAAYASSSNTSVGGNTCLESRNGVQSSAAGNNRNSHKGCSSSSEGSSSLPENILHLQSKPHDGHQNQLLPCAYDKMTNSSTNYIHHAQSDLPALPTLVGDLALGSCSSMKGYLPVYDEANSVASKVSKQDLGKAQLPNTNTISCSNMLPAKDNRDVRHTSSNHEYGISSFLSVSQLVEHVKDSSQQNQPRENERGEKARSREPNKSSPSSRRNVRPSNVKRDGVGTSKEQLEHSQISHSRMPPHDAQSFHNQGISTSAVSSNPTHLHAPPIPFPPYKSVHWPMNDMTKVTDNSRNTANYKSSSSYSAEALIRPSLSAVPIDSRIADVEMPAYGMDIHKFPIPSGRGDHLFPDFVESNNVSCNIDGVPQQQNQLKQQSQGNENFRSSHHSHCDRFNYSSSAVPSSTFHSHPHHPHLPPPSFANHEDYSVETSNPTSSLGLSANCMDFPFSHPKDAANLTSSASNVCLPLGYNSTNPCLGVNQSQGQQCRATVEKTSIRVSSENCEETSSRPTLEQLGPSKTDCNGESRTKPVSKKTSPIMNNNNARSIPPFLPMESNSASYIGHHHYHPHNHHNSPPHYPGASTMGPAPIAPLNDPEHQAPKLFPRLPPPTSGMTHLPPPTSGMTHLPHQSSTVNSSMSCGSTSGSNLSSGTLTNFNLSTIFPEINDKQSHHNQMAPSTSSFGTSSKNDKSCTVSSSAPLLHPPPLTTSYHHHHQPHQHNHQPFPPPVDLGNRLPPPHPSSSVLHSNVSFNNLMVQSTPQVNGIAINGSLQPPPPPFSAPSFANVLPGL